MPVMLDTNVGVAEVGSDMGASRIIPRAVAEKIRSAREHRSFKTRAARSVSGGYERLLAKAGTAEPITGDELPEGWLDHVPK
jgi:hypothetical protein